MSDDLAILADAAETNAATILARSGRLPLASYVLTPAGVQMLVAGADDEINRRMFAAVTKVYGAHRGATCTAVVIDTWMIPEAVRDDALIARIHARGGSVSEHPGAVERVMIVSGDGEVQEIREYGIERHHADMAEMRHLRTERREGDGRLSGMLLEMHHDADDLADPSFLSVMRDMEAMGLLDGTPVAGSTPRRTN